jgi:hypothetical protein
MLNTVSEDELDYHDDDLATANEEKHPLKDEDSDQVSVDSLEADKPLSKLEREWLEEIKQLEKDCEVSERVMRAAAEEAKDCKKDWEANVERLRRCIREGCGKQPLLPGMETSSQVCESEAWNSTPIDEVLTLTEKQAEKLAEAGVKTAGEFEFLRSGQKPDYPDGLRSIKGVGESTAEKWTDEMLEWIRIKTPIV